MAMDMAIRSSFTTKLPLHSSSSSSSSASPSISPRACCKNQLKPISVSLPTSTTISLLALFTPPHEAKAATLSKDQIVSSLNEVEKTIDQVQEVGSTVLDNAQRVLQVVGEFLKPAVEKGLPIAQKAGEEALKAASPAISEVSKKAQEAIQSSGIDTETVVTAAKTVADAAEKTTKVATPIASSTVEAISSADPTVIVGTAGALFVSYLLLPPIWSAISFGLRGYKGDLTPAQTLDLVCSQSHTMIDIRSEKDKSKAGVPRLPSSAKNRLISVP
ncbi:calcium sensing receptor, chloroplastic [Carica papaya]|uniref:calcium sensing receptor, chloroplastic n=1 Tax=Carica papaya TaxID=3649 RepID=UPI000B8CAF32|nr:calcium sensing receptor, chloroplastic [Carica papaya]